MITIHHFIRKYTTMNMFKICINCLESLVECSHAIFFLNRNNLYQAEPLLTHCCDKLQNYSLKEKDSHRSNIICLTFNTLGLWIFCNLGGILAITCSYIDLPKGQTIQIMHNKFNMYSTSICFTSLTYIFLFTMFDFWCGFWGLFFTTLWYNVAFTIMMLRE